ncbi:Hypothetical predicted protein [Paramuricea clavata]|uniref:Uncharacterized protein n=1 Tax=Paramuricea clavata TaxID=317549 RepID=A0A7D9HHK5_PARCT|nr:Hypothetical predicted protein [Paramuricea clavata]
MTALLILIERVRRSAIQSMLNSVSAEWQAHWVSLTWLPLTYSSNRKVEYKKREPNMTLVYDKMTRTYASRRYINKTSPTLQEINDKYPFLFDPQQVCK